MSRREYIRSDRLPAGPSVHNSLVEKGLVEKGELDRRTNYYTVTRRGKREIDARRDWEEQYLTGVDEE